MSIIHIWTVALYLKEVELVLLYSLVSVQLLQPNLLSNQNKIKKHQSNVVEHQGHGAQGHADNQ